MLKANYYKIVHKIDEMRLPMTVAANALMIMMINEASFVTAAGSTNSAEGLVKLAIGMVAKLAVVLGIFFFILGLIHYASAHADGDGPAKTKAVGQIAAGVMIVVVSMIINNNVDQLSSFIEYK